MVFKIRRLKIGSKLAGKPRSLVDADTNFPWGTIPWYVGVVGLELERGLIKLRRNGTKEVLN